MIDFMENAFEVALQRIEDNPSMCELEGHYSVMLSEMNEASKLIEQKLQLLNADYAQQMQLLAEYYQKKIEGCWLHMTRSRVENEYHFKVDCVKAVLGGEISKYENELEKLRQEIPVIKHIIYECERRKM